MNDRILEVVRFIIADPSRITGVVKAEKELYFEVKGTFWSLIYRGESSEEFGAHTLYLYPQWKGDLQSLVNKFSELGQDEVEVVAFHEREFRRLGEREILGDLYRALTHRRHNVDAIFSRILEE